ncbi:MAG: choice-of-anchor B domain-containing protein, partial [Glaciecola sp.]
QCVIYDGPDTDWTNAEICFAYNENEVVIVDMTDKILSFEIARFTYDQLSYTHQGWLTEDFTHILFNDEGEEDTYDINTRTLIADVSDLDNPTLVGAYLHDTTSIDHNNYILDGLAYQSNYTSGLRILDLDGVATAELETIGFFDTFPDHDNPVYAGTWGNYPYLPSGNIVISGGEEGLFIVRLRETVRQAYENPAT